MGIVETLFHFAVKVIIGLHVYGLLSGRIAKER